jgi:hypothetical protein
MYIIIKNKKFWEELIASFSFIRHEPHRKRRVQQFCYCCVCIRCRGNVLTIPFLATIGDTHTDTQIDGRDM